MQDVAVDVLIEAGEWPARAKLRALAERAIGAATDRACPDLEPGAEVSLLFTDDLHMRGLNLRYRGKDKPTNVLSFPQKTGALLGDVILAAETVAKEAALADKPLEDHMAHLIIHGFLHLLGFDHQGDGEAEKMEQLERVALKSLGIPDPYAPANPK